MALLRGTSLSRTIRLTEKGLSSIVGTLELFRSTCIGCGAPVSVTRFGAFTGAQQHTKRQCDALVAGTRNAGKRAVS